MSTSRKSATAATIGGLLLGGLLTVPTLLQAQPTAHYVPGVEGIKAGSLPPPGLYLKDYNFFYEATSLHDAAGNDTPGLNPRVFNYSNVPRLIWISDAELGGGYLGADGYVPLSYKSRRIGPPGEVFHDQTFGIGDFFAEGIWSVNRKQFDLCLRYGLWMPTGDFTPANPTRAGFGYFGHQFTFGGTWFPDSEKQWAISALNRYEFNQEQSHTHIIRGQAYTLEWGVSRTFAKKFDVGAVGYYQQQVTEDRGTDATSARDRVAAVGPEVNYYHAPATIRFALRYEYEFLAESRLQGQVVVFTITKRF